MRGGRDSRPARLFVASGAVAFVALLAGLAAGDDGVRQLLRYERTGLQQAEYWRLLTGHLAHLGWRHLVLNLVGLALIGVLFGRALRLAQWLVVAGLSMLAIDVGLYFAEPELDWYVGLSGVLHGLLAAAAVSLIARHATTGWIVAILLALKLAWEQWAGPLSASMAAAGGPVIVDAHLYGAVGGLLAAAIIRPFTQSGQT